MNYTNLNPSNTKLEDCRVMAKKTQKQRMTDYAARKRALGHVPRSIWAHPSDWPLIISFAKYCEHIRKNGKPQIDWPLDIPWPTEEDKK